MNAIDVWAQITTERMAKRPWLETLLRWTARGVGEVPSVESTVQAIGWRRNRAALGMARTGRQPDQQ
jgi:hypothetical protein